MNKWTSHGHEIPGVLYDPKEPRPPRARCGGSLICPQCALDVAKHRQDASRGEAMTTDDFTRAARAEAFRVWFEEPTTLDTISELGAHMAEWARDYLTERCTACGEDPSGPLRPLTTDERSYRYAQDLGYELPEDPR